MIQRCCNPSNNAYHYYGGRGITVCEQWRDSFETFLADVGLRPSNQHSLDRYPNNDGNYEPGNVRWATRMEQAINKRSNRWITAHGKTMTVSEWSRELGILDKTIYYRLSAGWSAEAAIQPVKKTH